MPVTAMETSQAARDYLEAEGDRLGLELGAQEIESVDDELLGTIASMLQTVDVYRIGLGGVDTDHAKVLELALLKLAEERAREVASESETEVLADV